MKLSHLAEMAKIDDAVTLYKQHVIDQGMPNKDFINLLVSNLNMTKAGATTYAYNAKKKWEQLNQSSTAPQPTPAARAAAPARPAPQPTPAAVTPTQQPSSTPPHMGDWMKKHGIQKYTVNANGDIDVDGILHTKFFDESRLPYKFGTVHGDFLFSSSNLTTLQNAPDVVEGDFFVDHAHLTNLHGAPHTVQDSIAYSGNPLTTLEGSPQVCGAHIYLENLPKIKSLQGIHKTFRQMNGELHLENTPAESHVLGILMIKGCKKIDKFHHPAVMKIINKHLEGDRDVHLCQDELIDAGFAQYARL